VAAVSVYVRRVDRDLGLVLGICGHWWQVKTVDEAMAKDCPTCSRPPGVFIDAWYEAWPDPDSAGPIFEQPK